MARPTARYVGTGAGELVPDLPESLKTDLRRCLDQKFSVDQGAAARAFAKGAGEADWRDANPSDGTIGALVAAAYRAKVELHQSKSTAVRKEDLDAEFSDLMRSLDELPRKLTSISLPLLRLLPVEADFDDVASRIQELVLQLQQSEARVARAGNKWKPSEVESRAAKHLARDVLDTFETDGLPLGNSVSADGTQSLLIQVLQVLGKAAELRRAPHTWKKDVMSAKAAKGTVKGCGEN